MIFLLTLEHCLSFFPTYFCDIILSSRYFTYISLEKMARTLEAEDIPGTHLAMNLLEFNDVIFITRDSVLNLPLLAPERKCKKYGTCGFSLSWSVCSSDDESAIPKASCWNQSRARYKWIVYDHMKSGFYTKSFQFPRMLRFCYTLKLRTPLGIISLVLGTPLI